MPDRKKKQNPQGDYSFLDNYVVVEGPESEEGDRESVASMPALQHPASNESNRQSVPQGPSNESRIEEDDEWEKMKALDMPEKDVRDDRDSSGNIGNLSFSLEKDVNGMPIISNELPPGMKPGSVPSGPGISLIDQEPLKAPQQNAGAVLQKKVSPLGEDWGYDEVPSGSEAPNRPKHHKKKITGPADGERIYNDPPIDNLDEIDLEDSGNANAPQQEAPQQEDGYSFPAKHKPRTKVPAGRAIYDRGTVIIGKTSAIPVTLIGGVYFGPKWIVDSVKLHNAKKTMQEKRDHDTIPGWNGAKFQKTKDDTGAHILLDQRRVPTVWSRMTGGKAEEEKGKPAAPEVTVYFDQPKQASSQSMVGAEMGHSMLGIEFSRFSRFTNRYERYKMQYGFYMAGGFTGPAASSVMANRNALVPGQLQDDWGHAYNVSRRYKATPAQINSIVKASETYADGGYGYYRRNCTTFVKEMVMDVGKLDTDGTIFEKEDARYTFTNNFFRWGGAALDAQFNTSMKSYMAKVSKQEDLSYQGYGNKRITKEELKNYENTNSYFTLHPGTYSPAASAENARRLTGKKSGVMGSYKYVGSLGKSVGDAAVSLSKLSEELSYAGSYLAGFIPTLLPPEQQDPDHGMPEPVLNAIQALYQVGGAVSKLDSEYDKVRVELKQEAADPSELFAPDKFRQCRQETTAELEKFSNMYRDLFKADERLYIPFSNLFSIYELCLTYLDKEYRITSKASLAQGDLGNIREEMNNTAYSISSGTSEAFFTPTHYESYIQIYKDPAAAIKAYARYNELKEKKKAAGQENEEGEEAPGLTAAEKAEYNKLARMESLALEFDASHNYLLEKQAFSQQDIDYVFALRRKSQHGIRKQKNEMLTDKLDSASIYQALLLEKIFGGMKDVWNGGEKTGGMSAKEIKAIKDMPDQKNMKKLSKWMDGFLAGRTQQKQKGMKMILKGIYRSNTDHTKDTIQQYVWDMMQNGYLKRVATAIEGNANMLGTLFSLAFTLVMADKKNKFPKLIRSISGEVLDEAAKAEKEAQAKAKAAQKLKEKELKAAQKLKEKELKAAKKKKK